MLGDILVNIGFTLLCCYIKMFVYIITTDILWFLLAATVLCAAWYVIQAAIQTLKAICTMAHATKDGVQATVITITIVATWTAPKILPAATVVGLTPIVVPMIITKNAAAALAPVAKKTAKMTRGATKKSGKAIRRAARQAKIAAKHAANEVIHEVAQPATQSANRARKRALKVAKIVAKHSKKVSKGVAKQSQQVAHASLHSGIQLLLLAVEAGCEFGRNTRQKWVALCKAANQRGEEFSDATRMKWAEFLTWCKEGNPIKWLIFLGQIVASLLSLVIFVAALINCISIWTMLIGLALPLAFLGKSVLEGDAWVYQFKQQFQEPFVPPPPPPALPAVEEWYQQCVDENSGNVVTDLKEFVAYLEAIFLDETMDKYDLGTVFIFVQKVLSRHALQVEGILPLKKLYDLKLERFASRKKLYLAAALCFHTDKLAGQTVEVHDVCKYLLAAVNNIKALADKHKVPFIQVQADYRTNDGVEPAALAGAIVGGILLLEN